MGYLSLDKIEKSRTFSFSGNGRKFFLICLANIFFVIITLGIYLPWAIMRARRYTYGHVSLDGQSFIYKGTGGSILLSICIITAIYQIGLYSVIHQYFLCGAIILMVLFLSLPFMMVKSLQYQASVTSLNGLRFGFQAPMLKTLWCTLILPILLMLLLCAVYYALVLLTSSWKGGVIKLIILSIIGMVGYGAIIGIVYGLWLSLFGNGIRFASYRTVIKVNLAKSIRSGICSSLILLPFIVVVAFFIGDLFIEIMVSNMIGEEAAANQLLTAYYTRFVFCYILLIIAIIFSSSYFHATLRNQFLNNLTLADGRIRLRSSASITGIMLRIFTMYIVSGITAGLAYPWLKMYYVRWLAEHTHVDGDLDMLDLKDDVRSPEMGPAMWISRGIMPYIPFL